MSYLFLGLAIANSAILVLTGVAGYLAHTGRLASELHVLAGLFASLFTTLTHCIVFVYFLGTGKSIKTACEELGLEDRFIQGTKRMKARAFPFALAGSLVIIGAAVTGGAASTGLYSVSTHHGCVIGALLFNLLCFFFEFRAIRANMDLIAEFARHVPDESVHEH